MRAIQTPSSNATLRLGDSGPEHDLPIKRGLAAGPDGLVVAGDPCYHRPYVSTVWEPSHEERAHLAIGRNIELVLMSTAVPPLAIGVTDESPINDEAAHAQPILDEAHVWMALSIPLCEDLVELVVALEVCAQDATDDPDVELEEGNESLERLGEFRRMLSGYLERLEAHEPEEEPEAEEPDA